MVDTFDKLLWELERCWMSTTRRQFTDEFKREAVGLLASSGRPLSQIARELGIAASMLRAWRDAGGGGNAGPPRRSNTQAAAPGWYNRLDGDVWVIQGNTPVTGQSVDDPRHGIITRQAQDLRHHAAGALHRQRRDAHSTRCETAPGGSARDHLAAAV